MFKVAIVTTFGYSLSAIAMSLMQGEVSQLTATFAVLITTAVTELVLYIGE